MGHYTYAFSTGALFPLRSCDALDLVKRAGFDGAELMPQSLYDTSDRSLIEFERVGLPITSIHYPLAFFAMLYTSQPDMLLDGQEYGRKLLRIGKNMGTRVLVVHPHVPSDEKFRRLLDQPIIDNLLWLADQCADNGITLAMENSPKTCSTSSQLKEYVRFLAHPNIKPMVDTTEVCESGGNPVDFLKELTPCHLHLSDFSGKRKHLPIGEGEIDWAGIKSALAGYDGIYTLEPSYRYYLEDILEKLEKANLLIRALMEGESEQL